MFKRRGATLLEYIICFVVYFGVIVTLLAMWTGRNLDFWLTHFRGHTIHVPFILDYLLAILSPVIVLANVIAEIARYCV